MYDHTSFEQQRAAKSKGKYKNQKQKIYTPNEMQSYNKNVFLKICMKVTTKT